jgi:hypothetical protein
MDPIRANPSAAPRLQNWVRVEQAVDAATVDVGFAEHHPKEPAAVHHDGRTHLACAVWDAYAFPPADKEVVLCTAPGPDGEFVQRSQVTDDPDATNHAPGVIVADGDLWVLYSRKAAGTRGNDVCGRHAPVDDIPSSPSGWTDAGVLFEDARDPGVVRSADGRYHLVATDERGEGVVHVDGPSLDSLSPARARTAYTNSFGEAPEVVPKASGAGYWLVTAEGVGEGPRLSVAGEAASLTDDFEGYYALGTHCSLGGIREPFHSEWTLHHYYLYAGDGRTLHHTGDCVAAFFEGGDGEQFSVGVGFLRDGGPPGQP